MGPSDYRHSPGAGVGHQPLPEASGSLWLPESHPGVVSDVWACGRSSAEPHGHQEASIPHREPRHLPGGGKPAVLVRPAPLPPHLLCTLSSQLSSSCLFFFFKKKKRVNSLPVLLKPNMSVIDETAFYNFKGEKLNEPGLARGVEKSQGTGGTGRPRRQQRHPRHPCWCHAEAQTMPLSVNHERS